MQDISLIRWVKHIARFIITAIAIIYSHVPINLRRSFLYYYKKNSFLKEEKAVFYSFDSHWNSIESFLPVLYWLKEEMGYRIISFWGVEDQCRYIPGNEIYLEMLINVSDVVVLNRFASLPFTGQMSRLDQIVHLAKNVFYSNFMRYSYSRDCISIFKKYNVVSILRVMDADVRIWEWLYKCFPSIKHIAHPHGGFIGMLHIPDEMWLQEYKRKIDKLTWTDTSCFDGPEEGSYKTFRERCVVVGTPRYDEWWRKKINNLDYRIPLFQKKILAERKKRKVVLVCLGALRIFAITQPRDIEVTLNELNELKGFLLNYNKSEVLFIFKFHPMTIALPDAFNTFFQNYVPKSQFEFQVTNLPLTFIAQYVDLVITVGVSTVAMDSVITGVPTIEFHEKREFAYWYKCPDGTYGSFLKLHQLALYASNAQELRYWTNLVFENKVSWDGYYQKLQKYIMLDGNASRRVGDIVKQYAESCKWGG